MPLDIVVGAQWGDEGKGRIVDLLSSEADVVARYCGGDNAGHTVTVDQTTFKLHLIPSGLVHPHPAGLLGGGMVINPATLLKEMDELRRTGLVVEPERLKISHAAHMITPGHIALDEANEKMLGDLKIGTTKRGIGPAYTSKVDRSGLRFEQILDLDEFKVALTRHLEDVNTELVKLYGEEKLDVQTIISNYLDYGKQLQPYVTEIGAFAHQALTEGKRVLAEGAQGTLLDLDHGTYPYVTSSTPTAPGVLVGLGLGIGAGTRVIGVVKAFQTRVGEGPFPTELEGELALRLRGTGENDWDEFGTTTGRPRRVGWLDGVLLRYSVRVNGLTELAVTKLDILSGFESLQMCTKYISDQQVYQDLPLGPAKLGKYKAEFLEIPGWEEDITSVRKWDDLPDAAQNYITQIEDLVKLPVSIISVGPERSQVILR
jgi:adenylosuccinate synthase